MPFDPLLDKVAHYYSDRVQAHGCTARGVDWNSPESQQLRFAQLLKICDPPAAADAPLVLNDYGCGYGALVDYLLAQGYTFRYCGFDIAEEMLARAREQYGTRSDCTFVSSATALPQAAYTLASGIMNVKLDTPTAEWQDYVLHTLHQMAEHSQQGFAFNMLTSYSDAEYMRPDLFYADPLWLFDYCKQHFSRYVALLHDYPLYEFTMLVRF
jgi:SAM-dependent methyltransferase